MTAAERATEREREAREIPWPGPRPYEEKHWRLFFGRAAEVRRVVSSVGANALSVLLGGSGTGKTSLVRAGAVPELRNRRYHPRGSLSQWPVLVLRRWGAESGTTIDRILRDQLKVAVDAIAGWGRREGHQAAIDDAELFNAQLAAATETEAVTDTLLRLAASVGDRGATQGVAEGGTPATGLILVFDQFEELLRPGGETSSDALGVIEALYQRGAESIHVLLSLRQEFIYALRQLESTVGGLAGRSIVLSPMPRQTVLDVMRDASRSSDVPIQDEAASTIVGWLSKVATRSDDERAATPDLLKLQAVLRELFMFAQDRDKEKVDTEVLAEFEKEFERFETAVREVLTGRRQTKDRKAERIVEGALERWIEYALDKRLADETAQGEAAPADEAAARQARSFEALTGDLPEERLRRQVRRIAIRIAPHLTALDYKVPQEENALFRLAVGEDIWRLGMNSASLRDRIRIVDDEKPRLNWDELEISEVLTDREKDYLSGLAKIEGWSPAETGNRLAGCFRETLHRLKQGNILTRIVKVTEEGKSSVWELVHDQFGPTFLKWAHEHKDSWFDCESSLTVSNGVQPIMAPSDVVAAPESGEKYVMDRISWRGCSVEPGLRPKLVLKNVHFVGCFLVGMVFDRCRFEGGSFTDCDLNGALFRNCEFVDAGDGPPVFELIDSTSLAIVASKIQSLEFRDCELQQPTIIATLDGAVRFKDGSRVAQAYFEVARGEAEGAKVDFEAGSRAFFCSANLDSLGMIDYGAQRDVASGALPEGFFERRPQRARRKDS